MRTNMIRAATIATALSILLTPVLASAQYFGSPFRSGRVVPRERAAGAILLGDHHRHVALAFARVRSGCRAALLWRPCYSAKQQTCTLSTLQLRQRTAFERGLF